MCGTVWLDCVESVKGVELVDDRLLDVMLMANLLRGCEDRFRGREDIFLMSMSRKHVRLVG